MRFYVVNSCVTTIWTKLQTFSAPRWLLQVSPSWLPWWIITFLIGCWILRNQNAPSLCSAVSGSCAQLWGSLMTLPVSSVPFYCRRVVHCRYITIHLSFLWLVNSCVLLVRGYDEWSCYAHVHMFSSLLGKYLGAKEPGQSRGRGLTLLLSTNMFSTLLCFTLQPAVNEFQLLCIPVNEEMAPTSLALKRIAKNVSFFSSFLLLLCLLPLKSVWILVDPGIY